MNFYLKSFLGYELQLFKSNRRKRYKELITEYELLNYNSSYTSSLRWKLGLNDKDILTLHADQSNDDDNNDELLLGK